MSVEEHDIEQRLVEALRSADPVEPSIDLWSRVVHSIEEDSSHRRRVLSSVIMAAATLAGLVLVGLLAATDGRLGTQVRPWVMEVLETVGLVVAVVVLGPAIRRFGRGYADDLWPAAPDVPAALLRLLDVAYYLVFTGYILLTAGFDFGGDADVVAEQIQIALIRLGALLLMMGLLHAGTAAMLPLVALVSNSTRHGRPLPRWLNILLIVAGILLAWQIGGLLLGLVIGAGGG